MTKSDHRLWVELNGLELHIYNRSEIYSSLERVFGLDNILVPNKSWKSENDKGDENEKGPPDGDTTLQVEHGKNMEFWHDWRDLIPVIKLELNMVS